MNATTHTAARDEYRVLKRALQTIRQNAMAGDRSGFESFDAMLAAIRATEARMFEIVAAAR